VRERARGREGEGGGERDRDKGRARKKERRESVCMRESDRDMFDVCVRNKRDFGGVHFLRDLIGNSDSKAMKIEERVC
jgi:hypothetical protein